MIFLAFALPLATALLAWAVLRVGVHFVGPADSTMRNRLNLRECEGARRPRFLPWPPSAHAFPLVPRLMVTGCIRRCA